MNLAIEFPIRALYPVASTAHFKPTFFHEYLQIAPIAVPETPSKKHASFMVALLLSLKVIYLDFNAILLCIHVRGWGRGGALLLHEYTIEKSAESRFASRVVTPQPCKTFHHKEIQ